MLTSELRKHFDLKPCPNPHHVFSLGNLIGEWVWAEDHWSQLQGDTLQTFLFSAHSIKNTNGTVAYSIVIWKLKLVWGWL
jgi:hypothetical protein